MVSPLGQRDVVNVRPVRWYPGYRSPMLHPENINYVIIRDNLEGMYPPREGDVSELGDINQQQVMVAGSSY